MPRCPTAAAVAAGARPGVSVGVAMWILQTHNDGVDQMSVSMAMSMSQPDKDPTLRGNQQQDVDSQQGTTECGKVRVIVQPSHCTHVCPDGGCGGTSGIHVALLPVC